MTSAFIKTAGALAAVGVGAAAYRWQLRAGAKPSEIAATLPGDDLVPDARVVTTRALTIEAPPDLVWPWLAQIGQNKAGFYTYEKLENLVGCDIRNADRIVAEWQDPQVGDLVTLAPDVALRVAAVDPGGALVLGTPEGPPPRPSMQFDFSWAFIVRPGATPGTSRFIARERYRPRNAAMSAMVAMVTPISALMTHGMAHGIRERVLAGS